MEGRDHPLDADPLLADRRQQVRLRLRPVPVGGGGRLDDDILRPERPRHGHGHEQRRADQRQDRKRRHQAQSPPRGGCALMLILQKAYERTRWLADGYPRTIGARLLGRAPPAARPAARSRRPARRTRRCSSPARHARSSRCPPCQPGRGRPRRSPARSSAAAPGRRRWPTSSIPSGSRRPGAGGCGASPRIPPGIPITNWNHIGAASSPSLGQPQAELHVRDVEALELGLHPVLQAGLGQRAQERRRVEEHAVAEVQRAGVERAEIGRSETTARRSASSHRPRAGRRQVDQQQTGRASRTAATVSR